MIMGINCETTRKESWITKISVKVAVERSDKPYKACVNMWMN